MSENPLRRGGGFRQPTPRKPEWLKISLTTRDSFLQLKQMFRQQTLHTVCEEARCPNIYECWNHGTATFMILGDICTRNCGFCAVKTGWPGGVVDAEEPRRVAEAVLNMNLQHVVITCVDRDDLPDGGAAVFAETIRAIRRASPHTAVEVLTGDFGGSREALARVMEAGPDIFSHNMETIRRLTPTVRSRATYDRSLQVLAWARDLRPEIPTKTGMMLGFDETREEILQAMDDIRAAGVEILTLGQYLQPTPKHLPVLRWVHPDEFAELRAAALARGFKHCEAGPLVRSSYHAWEQSEGARANGLTLRRAAVTAPPAEFDDLAILRLVEEAAGE